jgi:hypothetical protein
MHWKRLVQASEIFRQREARADRCYFHYIDSRDEAAWDSDGGPNDDEIEKLFRFLNQWGTRYRSDADARERFKQAYLHVLPLLKALQGHTLLEAEFDGGVVERMCVSDAVGSIFHKIASCGSRYESTATSKMLHVLHSPLFVMWDSAIRGGYAVDGRSSDYAERFLPRMQREAREAVGSYIADGKAGLTTAVRELERLCEDRPFTKLIDEYNYCRFTLRADELWR